MRVVIDSGIWISAFHFGGNPMQVIFKASEVDVIVFCASIQQEVEAVLTRKFGWQKGDVLDVLDEFVRSAVRVRITGAVAGICRDPKDDMVLECADAGEADLILTGDKDLLVLKMFRRIRIVTVQEYLGG